MSVSNNNQMPADIPSEKKFSFNRGKSLLCHIMQDNTKEVGKVKTKVFKQDFTWNKRIWAIDHTAIIYDIKGNAHYYVDVNKSDGTLRFSKSYIDRCKDCSKQIGIDAENARDLVKRKTISAIWGIDNSHIMLLMILAIVVLIMGIAIMLMYAETQKLNAQLIKQPNIIDPNNTTVVSRTSMILGVNIN